jgi:hypothetical protein
MTAASLALLIESVYLGSEGAAAAPGQPAESGSLGPRTCCWATTTLRCGPARLASIAAPGPAR